MRAFRFFRSLSSVGLLALGIVTICCASEPVQTATEDPPPAASLGANPVQYQLAEVTPQVQWQSSAIERSPMSLTAGDGSGLRLLSITGTVVIEDPLAFTELRLTFLNPENRRREGRFEFDLPDGGALSRLAMRIGNTWMEGEVVERDKARRTFETFVHTRPRVDPALLEKAAANRVSARVFPIQPHERKEIIVSYSQPLTGGGDGGSYRLPLQGLPQLDALDVRVIVKTADAVQSDRFVTASQRVIEVREREWSPDKDLVVVLDGAGPAAGMRAGKLAVARVRLDDVADSESLESLTILFDTSGSGARSFDREVDRLAVLLRSLDDTPTRIVAFDQTVALIHDGPAADAIGDILAGLRERRAFGASDLRAALKHKHVVGAHSDRLLIWSDGIATAGPSKTSQLVEAARGVPMGRIDSYATTASADRDVLAALDAARGDVGIVVGPDLDGAGLGEALTRRGFGNVEMAVPGAVWSYPRSLQGYAPGDDVVVYASFEDAAPAEVSVVFSDLRLGEHIIPTLEGATALVDRAVAIARVKQMSERWAAEEDPSKAESLRQSLVELAVGQRILTDHTALLVLENEREYRRYGIDRSALANILTVGPGGIDLLRRGSGPTGRALPRVDELLTDDLLADAQHTVPRGTRGSASVLEAMAAESGHFLASPPGAAWAVGSDDQDVWGGLLGTEVGEAFGVGGLGLSSTRGPTSDFAAVGGFGLSGTGRGGGGTGEGTIGLGNVGLIGKGAGSGTGSGYGRGSGRVSAHMAQVGRMRRPRRRQAVRRRRGDPSDGPQWVGSAQSGRFAGLQRLVADGHSARARTEAWAWATTEPDNALALVALGEMLELDARPELAARVYGSLIDLHPHRADMRRAAGARLEALGERWRGLALDTYRKAVAQRPDQINGHRLLAWALVKAGEHEQAFDVLTTALQTPIPAGRFNGVKALLRGDRRLVAAAWLTADEDREGGAPGSTARVRLRAAGVRPATTASLRLVADWETDATDVDLLVEPMGPGTGRRHADVRTGFGPEAWISRDHRRPAAVTARVRYFDRGAMGYAMGTVSAVSHDGNGHLTFTDRPFVLMEAVGSVELGRFRA
ncbi:MAG: hypothetical protein JKY37_26415 [Nannocystaceae bacterium]|nr:hypothetical protein [Nannocystaceae bacterium]